MYKVQVAAFNYKTVKVLPSVVNYNIFVKTNGNLMKKKFLINHIVERDYGDSYEIIMTDDNGRHLGEPLIIPDFDSRYQPFHEALNNKQGKFGINTADWYDKSEEEREAHRVQCKLRGEPDPFYIAHIIDTHFARYGGEIELRKEGVWARVAQLFGF